MLWNPRTFQCHANIPKFLYEVTLQILDFLREMILYCKYYKAKKLKSETPECQIYEKGYSFCIRKYVLVAEKYFCFCPQVKSRIVWPLCSNWRTYAQKAAGVWKYPTAES